MSSSPSNNPVLGRLTRRPLLLAIAIATVAVAGSAVAVAVESSANHQTLLASGKLSGVSWRLEATDSGGSLCLQMSGKPANSAALTASCGFGPPGHDGDETASVSVFAHDDALVFGPAPLSATRARIVSVSAKPICTTRWPGHPETVSITHPLPGWAPSGRWFLAEYPKMDCATSVVFLDAAGREVADKKFD